MTEQPFGGQSPFQQPQQAWQQPVPAMANTDVERLEQANVQQGQKQLNRAGVLVLSISTAVLAILVVLGLMIWFWGSGAALRLFDDPALNEYINSRR